MLGSSSSSHQSCDVSVAKERRINDRDIGREEREEEERRKDGMSDEQVIMARDVQCFE